MVSNQELQELQTRLEQKYSPEMTVTLDFEKREVICSPAISADNRRDLVQSVMDELESRSYTTELRNGQMPTDSRPVQTELKVVGRPM